MKERSFNALKWIAKYSGAQLWWVAFLSLLTGGISFGYILLALVSKKILDIATGDAAGSLWIAALQIAGIIALQAFMNILYGNICIRAIGKIDMKLKQGLFDSLLHKKYTELNGFHSGEILNRFTSDVDTVIEGVIDIVPSAIALMTRLVAGLVVLFRIDAKFTVAAIAVGCFVFVAGKLYSKHFKHLHKELQSANGVVRSFIQECIENIIVIKSFANDNLIHNRLRDRQLEALKLMYKKQDVSNVANTGVYVLFTGCYYAALIWGAVNIGLNNITFGTLTAFLQILDQIKAPMASMSGLVPKFYSMVASAERLIELEKLNDEKSVKTNESVDELYKHFKAIVFDKVDFSYTDKTVLEQASAQIRKGELVAVAGPSGIGKSTMMKLILGLIEPKAGKVKIAFDDREIEINSGIRGLFAYVPQGNMILSGTIGENIGFCKPNASAQELEKAAQLARIGDFIDTLPDKMNTHIGERGLGLSEGQAQRLSIARALLSDAPILLLDEATSALDEKTEKELIDNIRSLKNKTCIFISHKHRTIQMCDRILNFTDKHLSQCSFEELMESWNEGE